MGTITQTIRTGYELKIVWNIDSQSIPNNTSAVTAKVQLVSTGSAYTINSTAQKNGSLYIDGKAYSFTFSAALNGNQTKTIFTKSAIVSHLNDGSKTCTFKADVGIAVTLSGVYYDTVNISGSGQLSTIPRASSISLSSSTVEMGSDLTITVSRASTSFTHTIIYTFGNSSGTIGTGVATSKTWSVPFTLANAIPKATSGTGTITCKTYVGTTLVGSKSVNFTATVPSSVVPSVSSVTIAENISGLNSKFGAFVQGRSKLSVSISASGAYGSTIKTYETKIESTTYRGNSFISEKITGNGTISVTTKVTDTRGRTKQVVNNISVISYADPKIETFSAFRCDSSGNQDYEGQYLKIKFNYSISPVSNKNDKYYEIVYREKGATSWNTIASGNIYSQDTNIISSALFNPDNSYDLALNINDYFAQAKAVLEVPTAFTLVDYRSTGKGVEFGAVSNEDCFGVSMDSKFRKNVNVSGTFTASNIKYGTDSITPNANSSTSKTITFDVPFPDGVTPKVFVTARTTSPGSTVKGISVNNPSNTGFTVWLLRTDSTSTNFDWLAIGG